MTMLDGRKQLISITSEVEYIQSTIRYTVQSHKVVTVAYKKFQNSALPVLFEELQSWIINEIGQSKRKVVPGGSSAVHIQRGEAIFSLVERYPKEDKIV